MQRLTKLRELTRLLKQPSSFRWMGSICAVYSYCVQEKAESGVEVSSTVRRRNRRGKRSGQHKNRKCRLVTKSDPIPVVPVSTGSKLARRLYLINRREQWSKRRVGEIKRLIKMRDKLSRTDDRKWFLGKQIQTAKVRWAAAHALSTQGTLGFSKLSLQLLLTIDDNSWSIMSRGPDAPVNTDAYRAVPPPKELARKVIFNPVITPGHGVEYDDGESYHRPVVAKARKRHALREAAYQPPVLPERKRTVPVAKKKGKCTCSAAKPCRTCSGQRIKWS